MKKIQEFEFTLHDTGESVKALFADGEEIILDYECKKIRVRAPLPKKEEFIENAKYWVEADDRWQSLDQWVNFYAQCRQDEIYKQIQEMRKCLKRIKQNYLCVEIAKDFMQEYQESETK